MGELVPLMRIVSEPVLSILLTIVVGSMAWERIIKVSRRGDRVDTRIAASIEDLVQESHEQTELLREQSTAFRELSRSMMELTVHSETAHTVLRESLTRLEARKTS